MINKLSKNQQGLLNCLGSRFTTKIIDGELCIYLDLETHDIEISGGYLKNQTYYIYLWKQTNRQRIVEEYEVTNDNEKINKIIGRLIYRVITEKQEYKDRDLWEEIIDDMVEHYNIFGDFINCDMYKSNFMYDRAILNKNGQLKEFDINGVKRNVYKFKGTEEFYYFYQTEIEDINEELRWNAIRVFKIKNKLEFEQ